MKFRTAVSALALAVAATSASAGPIHFTAMISDGDDGVANFEVSNGADTGRAINQVRFSLGANDGLTFDSISNPSGSVEIESTNSGDLDLVFGFDSLTFLPGLSYTFSTVIRENDDDSVDSATEALFGNLEFFVSAGASAYSTTVTSAETILPDDGIDRDHNDDDNDGNGGDGSQATVSEPGTLGLMSLGLIGLASTYRRYKSS